MNANINDLLSFLNQSPTAWHAVQSVSDLLRGNGFLELAEQDSWFLEPGKAYFVQRNGSSLCAFVIPQKFPHDIQLIGSHTDSPGLKLKPNAEFRRENALMLAVEIYGSPLLSSWLNRDLGIAGTIVYEDSSNQVLEKLIYLKKHPVVIPQVAIHLDRSVNEQGLQLNKQEHLSALAAINFPNDKSYFETIVKEQIDFTKILGHDLFLIPIEPAKLIGYNHEFITSYRIDSLCSVHAATTALIENHLPLDSTIKMVVFWDNEEIGSNTQQGAASPFASNIIERIIYSLEGSREDFLKIISNSLCISVDLAHAFHPNYPEKLDIRHQPRMGCGVTIKFNAQNKYASNARSSAYIEHLCHKHDLPVQKFVSRNDMACGSTIGPIHASNTGMLTVDIGSPQLSMHSAREIMACQDYLNMHALLGKIFSK